MKKTHRRICYRDRARQQRRCLLIFLLIALLALGGISLFALADDGIESVTITVSSGDTLWDLCTPYQPKNMDLRDFVAKVKYVNKLKSSQLQIGQEVTIPLR